MPFPVCVCVFLCRELCQTRESAVWGLCADDSNWELVRFGENPVNTHVQCTVRVMGFPLFKQANAWYQLCFFQCLKKVWKMLKFSTYECVTYRLETWAIFHFYSSVVEHAHSFVISGWHITELSFSLDNSNQLEYRLSSSNCKLVSQKDLKLLFSPEGKQMAFQQSRQTALWRQDDLTSNMQTEDHKQRKPTGCPGSSYLHCCLNALLKIDSSVASICNFFFNCHFYLLTQILHTKMSATLHSPLMQNHNITLPLPCFMVTLIAVSVVVLARSTLNILDPIWSNQIYIL